MQQVLIDCATAQTAYVPLTPDEQAAYDAQQRAASQSAAQAAAELTFRALQLDALRGVAAALHGSQAALDAAALASLVHKLAADPPQPLSAPDLATLARFVLRCLLP